MAEAADQGEIFIEQPWSNCCELPCNRAAMLKQSPCADCMRLDKVSYETSGRSTKEHLIAQTVNYKL